MERTRSEASELGEGAKMFILRWDTCIITTALLLSFGCGDGENITTGSSDPPPAISAPASLAGRTLDATISAGSGAFATTGTFRISFTASTYAIMGDGVNTANSNGTYTYTAVGAVGTANITDNLLGNGNFAFTYTSASAGTYSANATVGGTQAGTFVEL